MAEMIRYTQTGSFDQEQNARRCANALTPAYRTSVTKDGGTWLVKAVQEIPKTRRIRSASIVVDTVARHGGLYEPDEEELIS